MKSIKILFIVTSNDELGNTGHKTGVWLEELATPYYIFKEAGVAITLASPDGGPVPVDPKSQSIMMTTANTKRFTGDLEAMNFLSASILLNEVNADDYDGVFVPGGHGPLWDIATSPIVKRILEIFNTEGKPIGAVCHGVAALLPLQDEKRELLLKGRQLTGFSNSEEQSAGLVDVVPFLLENELMSIGALYSKGANYLSYQVDDGNIITGQNAASSKEVANKLLASVQNARPVQKPRLAITEIL
jgi:putative intracellular protease/amidase